MNRWQKFGIGIAFAIIAVVALGFWAQARMRSFFCPVAPPMPTVGSEPMPSVSVRQVLEQLAALGIRRRSGLSQQINTIQPGAMSHDVRSE